MAWNELEVNEFYEREGLQGNPVNFVRKLKENFEYLKSNAEKWKVFKGKITQTGTNNPTVITLNSDDNDFLDLPTDFLRIGSGSFTLDLTDLGFTEENTILSIGNVEPPQIAWITLGGSPTIDKIQIIVKTTGLGVDGKLNNTYFEVRKK